MEEPKFTKGPWHVCSGTKSVQGICSCMSISCADHPIATVERGEWGDSYPSLRWVEGTGSIGRKAEAYMELIGYGSIPDEEAVANAHLLSAAPDLLEALKQARIVLGESGSEEHVKQLTDTELGRLWIAVTEMADAAIAKAEGREVVK